MFDTFKKVARLAAVISSFAIIGAFGSTAAFAADDTTVTTPAPSTAVTTGWTGTEPSVSFAPRCVSPSTGVAMFEVVNNESVNVTLKYSDAAGTGSKDLLPGSNQVYVPYAQSMNPDNLTVSFTYGIAATHKTEVQVHDTCGLDQLPTPAPVTGPCDTATAAQLKVVWNNDGQIVIATKSGLPLCESLDLYYSTYRMPDNYNGAGFSLDNTTSYPQQGITFFRFTLLAGSYGSWLENVPLPDYCSNVQADLYYGPQITNVGGNGLGYHADGTPISYGEGHGDQYIAGLIFAKDASKCAPGMGAGNGGSTGGSTSTPPVSDNGGSTASTPVTGGMGSGAPAPAAATTVSSTTPTVLPNTGVDLSANVLSTVISLIFGGTGMMAIGLRALRRF